MDPLRQLFTGPSDLLICFMTLHRVNTMHNIKKFYVESQSKMFKFSVVFSYIFSALIHLPLFWGYEVDLVNCKQFINSTLSLPHDDNCYSFLEPNLTADKSFWKPYLAVYLVTMKIVPALVIIFMNILMIKKLRNIMNLRRLTVRSTGKKTMISKDDFSRNTKNLPTVSEGVSGQETHRDAKKNKDLVKKRKVSLEIQETRLSILLVGILSSFTLLTTPNTILQCYWLWGDTKSLWTSSGFNLRLVSAPVNILLASNYSLNFYLYCLANKEMRDALVRGLPRCWCCQQGGHSFPNFCKSKEGAGT